MKIVVTGALGHIGSQYIRDLAYKYPGANIVLLDNLLTQRYCSLFNLPSEATYSFHELDVSASEVNLLKYIEDSDMVVHLAAITNAEKSLEWQTHQHQLNYSATKNIADACAKLNVPMIFISSTSVYGLPGDEVDEECAEENLHPQSPYAVSKLKEEAYLSRLGKSDNLKFIICRFGTIFGVSPGMRFQTAVNKFCWQAVTDQPVTVWETALHQLRPYLDLEDAINAMHFIYQNRLFNCQIYNVLTLNARVSDILDNIRASVPDLKIKFVDSKIMNQLSYHVLNKKFQSAGFQFKGNLQLGIQKTLRILKNTQTNHFKYEDGSRDSLQV